MQIAGKFLTRLGQCSLMIVVSFLITSAAAPTKLAWNERRQGFNEGWRFYRGEAEGAERPQFDDSKWRTIRLPHDWAIEGPFDRKINPHTGALPAFGTGWYRKSFSLPASAKGKYFAIEFDGAMSNSQVWLNGHLIGGRPYGYSSFQLDLTPYLNFGDDANVLAVRLTPEERSSRWYPGAGIYRNVWLNVTGPLHVAHWGTYVTTPQVSDDQATVAVKTEISNRTEQSVKVTLRTVVRDAAGRTVSSKDVPAEVSASGTATVSTSLNVPHPQRWSLDHPNLYMLVSEVMIDGKSVDAYTTPFGIRTIAFDKDRGFLLNGQHVRLHGVCDHHDLGALGAAVSRRATERQLQILKGAGVNAVRTSHNPPSPELLDLADRLGLLVMDEIFDMWHLAKTPNDYSKFFDEWSERDVRDFVHRDRNHPSVILWSIGNEIPEQRRANGAQEAHRLTGFFHEEDPTRPTTSAFNQAEDAIKNKLADEVDIPGFNYRATQYEQFSKEHPQWVIYGSETESCVSSRGVYHLPIEKYEKHPSLQLSSYDIIAPRWAYCPDVEFTYQDKLPQILGEFVWTGFDYIGEPTPFFPGRDFSTNTTDWPARSSYFGMVDLAGFPKDRYYLYQSEWTTAPMVHLLPHWNWEGHEGQPIPVMVYSNAETVELLLNGKSLGKKARYSDLWEMPVGKNVSADGKFTSRYRRIWQVPYQPGVLKAVAYQNGKQVAVTEVRTAGTPARVKLVPDRTTIDADGDDLSFITVRIEDKDGNLCPLADNLVYFNVTGAGTIAGVDNGNAATEEPFQADHRKAFNGLALLIVRSKAGAAGAIRISATSDQLIQGGAEVSTRLPHVVAAR